MRLHRSEKDHRIEGVLRFSAFQLARKKPRTISLQVNRCTSTDLPDASNESSMAAQRRAEARVASTQLYGAQKPHTDTGTCTRANTHTHLKREARARLRLLWNSACNMHHRTSMFEYSGTLSSLLLAC